MARRRRKRGSGGNRYDPLPAGTGMIRIIADHEPTRRHLETLVFGDPDVRLVTGPDRYEDGHRVYAKVQVAPFTQDDDD